MYFSSSIGNHSWMKKEGRFGRGGRRRKGKEDVKRKLARLQIEWNRERTKKVVNSFYLLGVHLPCLSFFLCQDGRTLGRGGSTVGGGGGRICCFVNFARFSRSLSKCLFVCFCLLTFSSPFLLFLFLSCLLLFLLLLLLLACWCVCVCLLGWGKGGTDSQQTALFLFRGRVLGSASQGIKGGRSCSVPPT